MTTPSEEYREITLTQGQVAKVSPHRFEELSQWKWQANWCEDTQSFYAQRTTSKINGKRQAVIMHRHILGLLHGDPRKGDHRDHDTLNNTDGNLRIASAVENHRNQNNYRNNTSGFKGVSWHSQRKRWWAYIRVNGRVKSLGLYDTPEEAHQAYCEGAKKFHGEFANF